MVLPRSRASLVSLAALSATGAATTWVALLAWAGFMELPGRWMAPMIALGATLVATGALARWWRAPSSVVVAAQLGVSFVGASLVITGSPLPLGSAWDRLVEEFQDAVDSANKFAPPVPDDVPGVDPILLVGGLAMMLLVDVLACTLRRVPLAGLPLLTIFSVPLSTLGSGPSWWVFVLTAAGFLTMLFIHEDEQVSRWGRSLDRETGGDVEAFGVRTGAVRANAGAIGGVVTALAIVAPVLIPTLDINALDIGPGSGGSGDINIENPMVDLRRDLVRGEDDELITVVTDDPDPSYLRIAVLNRFSAEAWSSGDRDVPSSQQANGRMPILEGVDPGVPREEFDYELTSTEAFKSKWLPVESHISEIDAPGDWRYDVATRDFLASDDDLDASDLAWSFTGVDLQLDANELVLSTPPAGLINEEYTSLPEGLAPLVRALANSVTEDAPSRFEKAVALQRWFREDGGFEYSIDPDRRQLENGADDLEVFLRDSPGGRTGYCEQFAAAMAVMARILGIPSRVAVGFLHPDQVGDDTFIYSAHDLHAWPELYFTGAGWVRFEPTPGGRADTVPGYTTQSIDELPEPTANPTDDGLQNPDRIDSETPGATPEDEPTANDADQGPSLPWLRILVVLVALALVVIAVLTPRTVRRNRRASRLASGPEAGWLELRDTTRDLGVPWPRARSPRETADALMRSFGAPPDEFTPERPRRGPDTNPTAVEALDRLVLALELLRYAERSPGPDGSWAADVETCVLALTGGCTARARRRAEWWPRSLFVRNRAVTRVAEEQSSSETVLSGTVDHVG